MKYNWILTLVLLFTSIGSVAQSPDEYYYIKNNKTGIYIESRYKFEKTGLVNKEGEAKYRIISQYGGYLQTDPIYPYELMIAEPKEVENQYFILKETDQGSYHILSSARNMYLTIISDTDYHIYPRIAQPKPDYQLWLFEIEAPAQPQKHYYTFSKVESASHLEGMKQAAEKAAEVVTVEQESESITPEVVVAKQEDDAVKQEVASKEKTVAKQEKAEKQPSPSVEVKPLKTKRNSNIKSYASFLYATKPTAQSSMNMMGFSRHVFKPELGYYYSAATSIPFLSYNRTKNQMDIRYRHASQITGGITYRLNDYIVATAGIGLGTNRESISYADETLRKSDVYLNPEIGLALDLKYITLLANYCLPFPISLTPYRYNYFTCFSFGAGISPDLLTILNPKKEHADRITFEMGQKVYNVRHSNVLMTNIEGSYSFLGDGFKLLAGMGFAYSPISMDWTILRLGGQCMVGDMLALQVYYNAADLLYQSNKGSILAGGIGFKASAMFHFISLSPYIEYYFPYGNYAQYSALVYMTEKFSGWNIGMNMGISLGF